MLFTEQRCVDAGHDVADVPALLGDMEHKRAVEIGRRGLVAAKTCLSRDGAEWLARERVAQTGEPLEVVVAEMLEKGRLLRRHSVVEFDQVASTQAVRG